MKLDLHVHSCYSADAITKPATVLKTAKQLGITVGITEHNNADSWPAFRKAAKKLGVEVVYGEEVEVLKEGRVAGHFIGLFLQEGIKPGHYSEVIDEIKAQGGLLIVAHPFDYFRTPCTCLNEVAKKLDLVEVLNARCYLGMLNRKAQRFALKNNIPMCACSDAHTPEEIGCAYTLVRAGTAEEARRELEKGKTQIIGQKSGLLPHLKTMAAKLNLASDI